MTALIIASLLVFTLITWFILAAAIAWWADGLDRATFDRESATFGDD